MNFFRPFHFPLCLFKYRFIFIFIPFKKISFCIQVTCLHKFKLSFRNKENADRMKSNFRRRTYVLSDLNFQKQLDHPISPSKELEKTRSVLLSRASSHYSKLKEQVVTTSPEENRAVRTCFKYILNEIKHSEKISTDEKKKHQQESLEDALKAEKVDKVNRAVEIMTSSFALKNFDLKNFGLNGEKTSISKQNSLLSVSSRDAISVTLSLAEKHDRIERQKNKIDKRSLKERVQDSIQEYTLITAPKKPVVPKSARSISRLSRFSSKHSIGSTGQLSVGFSPRKSRFQKALRNLSLISEKGQISSGRKVCLKNMELNFQTEKMNVKQLPPYMIPVVTQKYKLPQEPELVEAERNAQNETALETSEVITKLIMFNNRRAEKIKNDFVEFENTKQEISKQIRGKLFEQGFKRGRVVAKKRLALKELIKSSKSTNLKCLTLKELRMRSEALIKDENNTAREKHGWFTEMLEKFVTSQTKLQSTEKQLILGLNQIVVEDVYLSKEVLKSIIKPIFEKLKTQSFLMQRMTSFLAFSVVHLTIEEFKQFLVDHKVTVPQNFGENYKRRASLQLSAGIRAFTIAMKWKRQTIKRRHLNLPLIEDAEPIVDSPDV